MDGQAKNKLILFSIFLGIQVLFIIILVSIIATNTASDEIAQTDFERKKNVSIEDLDSQLPYAPYSGHLMATLTTTIEQNATEFDPEQSTAIIRDGSLKTVEFENISSVFFSAIIDIPNLEQSYQVYSMYPQDTGDFNLDLYNTQYVLCLDEYSKKIYPDFNCHDLFESDTRRYIASKYLSYFNFNNFSPSVSQDFNTVGILPLSSGEITKETADSYIEQTKSAISSLGISPDLFTYSIIDSTDPSDTNYSLSQP